MLTTTIPILRIFDEAKAKEFYVWFLGFAIEWEHRFNADFPLYLGISRDKCVIHLSEHHGDCTPGAALRIETDDIAALQHELAGKQYKYARPGVSKTEWGTMEMEIKDLFGNRLVFFQLKP